MPNHNYSDGQAILMPVAGMDIYFTRKRIKNINLRINAQGQIKVSAPMRCSLRVIEGFLQEKRDWITHHREQLLRKRQQVPSQFLSGEQHHFLGKVYTLMIHEHTQIKRVALEGDLLCCYFKESASLDKKRILLQQWHRTQMSALIPDLLEKWEFILGVQVNQWGIKAMKTRWGTCNPTKKRIWLNLHLIHKPLSCLEYVLVHELIHLLEASHNHRFYALMSQYMPDWQTNKKLLNNK